MKMIRKVQNLVWVLLGILMLNACSSKDKKSSFDQPASVTVSVRTTEGKIVKGEIVKLFDRKTFELFHENPTTQPLAELATDGSGNAIFMLEPRTWFHKVNERDLVFVVIHAADKQNYQWWSQGGLVKLGGKHAFRIVVEENNIVTQEDLFQIEDGVLVGVKDKTVTVGKLPEGVKRIADEALYGSTIQTLLLPEGLEEIGLGAFRKSAIKSINFPSTLKTIGAHAFEDCSALGKVDLSKTKLTAISSDCFRDCGIVSIELPSTIRKIDSQAFAGSKQLSSISLPGQVERIETEAFRASGLQKVEIPNAISYIGYQAFCDCQALIEFIGTGACEKPNGVMDIGCLQGCTALQHLTLPAGIVELSGWNFIECSALKEITLPAALAKIGDYGLVTNSMIDIIKFHSEKLPELGTKAMPLTDDIRSIAVPKGCLGKFQEQWKDRPALVNKLTEL